MKNRLQSIARQYHAHAEAIGITVLVFIITCALTIALVALLNDPLVSSKALPKPVAAPATPTLDIHIDERLIDGQLCLIAVSNNQVVDVDCLR